MTDRQDKDARGPLGDARPGNEKEDPRAEPSLQQEDIGERVNVGSVKPEDYPAADRADSSPDKG